MSAPDSPPHSPSPSSPSSPAHHDANGSIDSLASFNSLSSNDTSLAASTSSFQDFSKRPLTLSEKLDLATKNHRPQKTSATVTRTWEPVGRVKKIVVKKRVRSVVERRQEERERLEKEDGGKVKGSPAKGSPAKGGPAKVGHAKEAPAAVRESSERETSPGRASRQRPGSTRGNLAEAKSRPSTKGGGKGEGEEEGEREGDEGGEGGDGKMHMCDVVSALRAKVKSDMYMQAARDAEAKRSGRHGLRDWPPWLAEYSKPPVEQARNSRLAHRAMGKLVKDPDSRGAEIEGMERKKRDLVLPKIEYESWASHVPMPLGDKRSWSVALNRREPGDWFRLDSLGWTKDAGHLNVLRSPPTVRHMAEVTATLSPFLTPASKNGDKVLEADEKVRVIELGCGSGEHAVEVCGKNKDVVWLPLDNSKLCVDSTNARAKFYDVMKNDEPKHVDGNVYESFQLEIMNYEKAIENERLDGKWRSVDLVVAMNVVQYAPYRFMENFFRFADEVVKVFGCVFLYGPFRVDGCLTREQEIINLNLGKQSAKFGIRDQEDIVAIAKEFLFVLDLKFDLTEGNVALVFKKTPKEMAKIETKVETVEKKEEGAKRGDRPSMGVKLRSSMKSVKNAGSFIAKSLFGASLSGKKKDEAVDAADAAKKEAADEAGEDGEGDGDGDEKAGVKRQVSKTKKNPRKSSLAGRKSKNPRRSSRSSSKGKGEEEGEGEKKETKSQRSERKSRMSRATSNKGKGAGMDEKAAEALAQAAISKFD